MPSKPPLQKIIRPFDDKLMSVNVTQPFGQVSRGLEPMCFNYHDGVYGFKWLDGATEDCFHTGVDYSLNMGIPLRAVADGTVRSSQDDPWGFGLLTILEHSGGLLSFYAHQSATYVAQGAKVRQGDHIGDVGSSGNSTGPHLHYATAEDDGSGYYYFFDPAPYIFFQETKEEQLPTARHYRVLTEQFLRLAPRDDAAHGRLVKVGDVLTAKGGWTTHWREITPGGTWAKAINLTSA
jgi:murein DD-endopeptidase MepM/ murein hydrolase activator NlpD